MCLTESGAHHLVLKPRRRSRLREFTALTAADALSFEDGLKVRSRRGRYMQEACEATQGSMAAGMGLDEAATRTICEEAGVALAQS